MRREREPALVQRAGLLQIGEEPYRPQRQKAAAKPGRARRASRGRGRDGLTYLLKSCRPVSERTVPEALYARVQGDLVNPRVEAIERVQDALRGLVKADTAAH